MTGLRRLPLAAAIGVFLTWPTHAQSPAFEVASVKVNTSGATGGSYGRQGSQVVIRNYTLRDIILNAYNIRAHQLVGAPDWIASARFDIVAKEPEGVPPSASMMHALLADRFRLAVHTETRQAPIYELVIARADGRLGPQMQPADAQAKRGASSGPGRLQFRAYTSADLARNLSNWSGRLVVDRTSLTGTYTGELTWTPDNVPPGQAVDQNAPSIFAAVQEQLGLKLEPAMGPTEMLVVDSVERPTPD